MAQPQHFIATSGAKDSVWVHTDPYSQRPRFPKLTRDLQAEVCVVGSGIAGVSTAYELVSRGVSVVMLEARDVVSGESGRTSGHLSTDGFVDIAKKHGNDGAKAVAESYAWAIKRVGEISSKLGVDCEYRQLPAYHISQYARSDESHAKEVESLKEEVSKAGELGLSASFEEGYAIKGWDGKIDQRDAAVFNQQATFHPTKYIKGVLAWLSEQSNFTCFTRTRVMSIEEKGVEILGIGSKDVRVSTLDGHTVICENAVEATCIPLQKLSVVAQLEFMRTYCIAIRVPKGYIEDCLIYDVASPYRYVRLTACDEEDDYLVVGGCDHKVGQEDENGRFNELEDWTRQRFTKAKTVDYKWSGQVLEPVDHVAMIGLNQGKSHIYIATGDAGNGLVHYVLGGKLIADLITKTPNSWSSVYSPKRLASIASSLPSMISHDVQINAQYKRFLQSDISDIEDLAPGTGGVLNTKTSKPVAVYKDGEGKVSTFSALCPHLKGVVCWNGTEESWDCPIHGSRFSKDGVQVMGPAKAGLSPVDKEGEVRQQQAVQG
ncbi:hypothetical protein HO133_007244 [Letharia lupina]|uniref:Rieske domain-containing protein n=1 Tax=Letharia lupina TaxID=560253 RepID=A0A8H6FIF7_9LECA|nr:uncharacterized protein HO133_007244 [Letharia lupina]KAF6229129.1 hypothetical protein HO133_007244 [Letharia lupina]